MFLTKFPETGFCLKDDRLYEYLKSRCESNVEDSKTHKYWAWREGGNYFWGVADFSNRIQYSIDELLPFITNDMSTLFDEHQEEICRLCEDAIIGGSSCSSNYMCEGSHCEEAVEMFVEDLALGELIINNNSNNKKDEKQGKCIKVQRQDFKVERGTRKSGTTVEIGRPRRTVKGRCEGNATKSYKT